MAPSFNHTAIAARIMAELPHRDREVLSRFYLLRQTPQEIQESLGIDPNEFSRIKARAKRHFFDIISGREL
jgi:DNA-directed RNA polymerase specialized sigma subunit